MVHEHHLSCGVEPVERTSLQHWRGHTELRDDRTALFETWPGDSLSLTYRFRVEKPGTYHCLPAQCFAMYEPAVHGTSAGRTLRVVR